MLGHRMLRALDARLAAETPADLHIFAGAAIKQHVREWFQLSADDRVAADISTRAELLEAAIRPRGAATARAQPRKPQRLEPHHATRPLAHRRPPSPPSWVLDQLQQANLDAIKTQVQDKVRLDKIKDGILKADLAWAEQNPLTAPPTLAKQIEASQEAALLLGNKPPE